MLRTYESWYGDDSIVDHLPNMHKSLGLMQHPHKYTVLMPCQRGGYEDRVLKPLLDKLYKVGTADLV